MKKQRLYHSNFNHLGCIKAKGDKSRGHNLRAKNALQNLYKEPVELSDICTPEKIKNNLLLIPDENGKLQKVNPLNGDLHFEKIKKQLADEKAEYLHNLENAYSDSNKAQLSGKRAKAKAALKRFANSSTDLEKAFWEELTVKLGSEQIDTETEIAKLKATGNKISRFNQKVKRINELSDYNGLIGVKSRNTEYTVYSKEILYKIPDDTDLNIKPVDMANFVNNMNKKLYPDFNPTYIAIHADENEDRAHAHCEFSGRNKKTGDMDIQQQLFLNLEKQFKLKNKPFPFENKSYNSLDVDQVKIFGEIYQDYIFEEMNSYLLKKGYNAKLEKRTEEEKKNDSQKFFDKHKSTQDREYTRAKKLKIENEKSESKLSNNKIIIDQQEKIKKEQSNQIDKNDNLIDAQEKNISENDKTIKTQEIKEKELKSEIEKYKEKVSFWKKAELKAQTTFYFALDYAKSPDFEKLLRYKESFSEIENSIISKIVKSKSIEEQPTPGQKEAIKNASTSSTSKPPK